MSDDKNKVGKPLIFKTPQDLQNAIDIYFDDCKNHTKQVIDKTGKLIDLKDPLIPCIAGLAYAMGVDRQTVYNYADRDEYFDIIKKARDYIFSLLEEGLTNSTINPTGKIFLAKNYGYIDKQVIEEENNNQLENINDKIDKLLETLKFERLLSSAFPLIWSTSIPFGALVISLCI